MWRSRADRGLRRRVEAGSVIACLVLLSIGAGATRAGANGAGKDAGATSGICHAMGTQDEVAPDQLPVPQKQLSEKE